MTESSTAQDTPAPDTPPWRRSSPDMILSTTPTLDGFRVVEYLGIVRGEADPRWRKFTRDENEIEHRKMDHPTGGYTLAPVDPKELPPMGREQWNWEHLREAARRLGANAVVGLVLSPHLAGTAVRVERFP